MLKVMIVDDCKIIRNILKDILLNNHCEVVCEAQNGNEAVENFSKYKPELVIMDVNMPEMNGLEALQKIKKIDQFANVSMLSAMSNDSTLLLNVSLMEQMVIF